MSLDHSNSTSRYAGLKPRTVFMKAPMVSYSVVTGAPESCQAFQPPAIEKKFV